ncbi:MAG: Holliday junction resolvase RuvX [Betaproteobacteria bacterium]
MHSDHAETILGFDFGEKRIGVAVGNTITWQAQALTTLHVESNAARLGAVAKLVTDWQPASFVVGQPEHADGTPHEVAHLAKKFGNRLTEKFRLPVAYVNETLSSVEASSILGARGVNGIAQKSEIDAVAAQVILQSFLDERASHAA